MKKNRIKIDLCIGITVLISFTLVLLTAFYFGEEQLSFYFAVGILFIGSLVCYYKGMVFSICHVAVSRNIVLMFFHIPLYKRERYRI